MRGKPRRILCWLRRRTGMWLLCSDEQSTWEQPPARRRQPTFMGLSRSPGCVRHQCVSDSSLLLWIFPSFFFFLIFLVCPLTEEAADNELSISPKKWIFSGVAVISRQKLGSSVFTVINIHPSALKSAVCNKCKKLNILLLS